MAQRERASTDNVQNVAESEQDEQKYFWIDERQLAYATERSGSDIQSDDGDYYTGPWYREWDGE